jgi:hypothetical protein
LLVLAISLFFGQIFSVVGALLISPQSVAATIVKTTLLRLNRFVPDRPRATQPAAVVEQRNAGKEGGGR